MAQPTTVVAQSLPDSAELEKLQLHLTNEKLKIETAKLAREVQPERWWLKLGKNVLALGGLATVAGTLYGVWDSYNKTIDDRERTRVATQRTRFEDAIKRLESTSTISKLVGVSILSGYLNSANSDAHRQILFTLSGLMATEKDFQTQVAVIDLVTSLTGEKEIKPSDWHYFQEMLVSQSRALVEKSALATARYDRPPSSKGSDEESSARTVGKLISAIARTGVLKNYADYRGIYCIGCDFRNTAFPAFADFTNAVLEGANFSGATLRDATFDNADLSGANFVEADLRNARFRNLDETYFSNLDRRNERVPEGRWTLSLHHLLRALKVRPYVAVDMPNFSCANMKGVDFGTRALFPAFTNIRRSYVIDRSDPSEWDKHVTEYMKQQAKRNAGKYEFTAVRVEPPNFFKADLTGANLGKTKYFSLISSDQRRTLDHYMLGGWGRPVEDMMLWEVDLDPDKALKWPPEAVKEGAAVDGDDNGNKDRAAEQREVESLQRRLRAAFHEAEIDKATLPPGLLVFLKLPGRAAPGRVGGIFDEDDRPCTRRGD